MRASVLETRRNNVNKMYGDWLVWHSDHPQFKGSNANVLSIYPRKELAIRRYVYYGPIYCSILMRGRFKILTQESCSENLLNLDELNDGCSLSLSSDVCEDCHIKVNWYEEDTIIDSVFGIGINEWKQIVMKNQFEREMNMTLTILDSNDIYISTFNYNIHLIRNTQPNLPSPNTSSLSSFIVSQLLGNIIFLGLHTYFHDIF
uniref:Uncharacterized protein n=1 Tax=viral metagenome TaxID=1070528 RepID=A0A6C0D2B6_9ZZZZ